jgi:hypothetical protein
MATNDSIQLALRVVNSINDANRTLRAAAENCRTVLSEVDSIMVNPAKKAILLDGLAGLSVDAIELKNTKDNLQAVDQYILDNVPELTS